MHLIGALNNEFTTSLILKFDLSDGFYLLRSIILHYDMTSYFCFPVQSTSVTYQTLFADPCLLLQPIPRQSDCAVYSI